MLFRPDPVEILPRNPSAVLHYQIWDIDQAEQIMDDLVQSLTWQQPVISVFGRRVDQPRLTAWYGDPGRNYSYSGIKLHPLPWSPLLSQIRERCQEVAGTTFNSVLANLYRDGNDSVSWHADNEPELGSEPVIASASFGATRSFHMRHTDTGETVKVSLPPGCVIVMSGQSQSHWRHQVPKTTRRVEARINLTFRTIRD